MTDQWIVYTAHDFYTNVPVPRSTEMVLVKIVAAHKEGKTFKQIRDELADLGEKVSLRDIRGVLAAYQQHTGEDLGIVPKIRYIP